MKTTENVAIDLETRHSLGSVVNANPTLSNPVATASIKLLDTPNKAFTQSTPLPPFVHDEPCDDNESERERLLRIWRLYPEAEVDLCSDEVFGGARDGTGLVNLSHKDGDTIEEFRFGSALEADEAVDYALRAMNPGS